MQKGFSVLEVVLAAALFMIFAVGAAVAVIQGYNANRLGQEYTVANQFAAEGIEAVKSIKNQDYANLVNSAGTGVVRSGSNVWAFGGVNNTLIHNSSDNYIRIITIEDVYRDAVPPAGNIVSSGTLDPDTKKVTSTVTWNFNSARPESIALIAYLSNWRKELAGASAPSVTTSAATNITSSTATLNGSGNPNSASTTGWFRYATTDPGTCDDIFGTRVPLSGGTDLGSGTSPVSYFENISSLSASTTYYFCAVASNSQGTGVGSVLSFTTEATAPSGIEYVGSISSAGNNTTAGSFSLPGGWNPGDVAVFWWYTYDNNKTITPPAELTQKQQASSADFGRIYIAYRVLQTGDSTFAWTASSVNNSTTIWGTSVFSGVNTSSDPFEAQSGAPLTFSNTANPDPPAVITVSDNAMVVPIFGKNNDYSSITPPAGYTTAGSNDSPAGRDASAGAAYFKRPTIGTEDPGPWSAAGAATDNGYVWTGALKP